MPCFGSRLRLKRTHNDPTSLSWLVRVILHLSKDLSEAFAFDLSRTRNANAMWRRETDKHCVSIRLLGATTIDSISETG